MNDDKRAKGPIGIFLLGIVFMGALYGWIAYADEIGDDIQATVSLITSNGGAALDPNSLTLLQAVGTNVETQQNNAINADLYGSNNNAMISNHFSRYCAQPSESAGSGGACPTDVLLQFGDTKFSSVNSSSAYDTSTAQAAQDFSTNLFYPPNGPNVSSFQANVNVTNGQTMNPTTLTDPTLQKNFIQALSDEALLSVARQPFAEMIAKRTSSGGAPTQMQLMEEGAMRRIMSADWKKALSSMQPQDIAKEQAMMQAYQVWMEYQRYRQTERVEALLAVLVLQGFHMDKFIHTLTAAPSQQSLQQQTSLMNEAVGKMGNEVIGKIGKAARQAGGTSLPPMPDDPVGTFMNKMKDIDAALETGAMGGVDADQSLKPAPPKTSP